MNDLIVKEVNFNGATLVGVLKDGKIYTPLKKFCEFLGIDFEGQRQRIRRDETLCLGTTTFKIKAVENNIEKMREMLMLEISYLPLWLTGIKAKQCREKIRKNLTKFKLEAKDILADAFFGKREKEISLLPVDKDWGFKRIHDRVDQAKEIEKQIHYLIKFLEPIYDEIEAIAKTKRDSVFREFKNFKKESEYDASKEKLPIIWKTEIEEQLAEKINKSDMTKEEILEKVVKVLENEKTTNKE